MINGDSDVAFSLDKAAESVSNLKGILKNKKENLRNSQTQLNEIKKIAHDRKKHLKIARSNIEKHVTILEEKTEDLNKSKKEQNENLDIQIKEVKTIINDEKNNLRRLKSIEQNIEKELNNINLSFSSAYEDFREVSNLNEQGSSPHSDLKEIQESISKTTKEINYLYLRQVQNISRQINIENSVHEGVINYFKPKLLSSVQNEDEKKIQEVFQNNISNLNNKIEMLQKSECEFVNQLQKKVSEIILKRKQWKKIKKELLMSCSRENKFNVEILPEFKQSLNQRIEKIHENHAIIISQIEECQFDRMKLRRVEKNLLKKKAKYESKFSQETTKGYELEIQLNDTLQKWIPIKGELEAEIQNGQKYAKILTKLQSQIIKEKELSNKLANYKLETKKEMYLILPENQIMINAFQNLIHKTNSKIDKLKSEVEMQENIYQATYTQLAQTRYAYFRTQFENSKKADRVKIVEKKEILNQAELLGISLTEQINNIIERIALKRSRINFKDQNLTKVENVHGISNHYQPFVIEDFERVYDRNETRKQRVFYSFERISNLEKVIGDLISLERSYMNHVV